MAFDASTILQRAKWWKRDVEVTRRRKDPSMSCKQSNMHKLACGLLVVHIRRPEFYRIPLEEMHIWMCLARSANQVDRDRSSASSPR